MTSFVLCAPMSNMQTNVTMTKQCCRYVILLLKKTKKLCSHGQENTNIDTKFHTIDILTTHTKCVHNAIAVFTFVQISTVVPRYIDCMYCNSQLRRVTGHVTSALFEGVSTFFVGVIHICLFYDSIEERGANLVRHTCSTVYCTYVCQYIHVYLLAAQNQRTVSYMY
jgi:hypothetical protein